MDHSHKAKSLETCVYNETLRMFKAFHKVELRGIEPLKINAFMRIRWCRVAFRVARLYPEIFLKCLIIFFVCRAVSKSIVSW